MELLELISTLSAWVKSSGLNLAVVAGLALLFSTSLFLALREFAAWFAHVRAVEKELTRLQSELRQLKTRVHELENRPDKPTQLQPLEGSPHLATPSIAAVASDQPLEGPIAISRLKKTRPAARFLLEQ